MRDEAIPAEIASGAAPPRNDGVDCMDLYTPPGDNVVVSRESKK